MKWPWRKHSNGKKAAAVRAEAELEATKRQRVEVERKARELAALPPDEFMDRITRTFGRRAT